MKIRKKTLISILVFMLLIGGISSISMANSSKVGNYFSANSFLEFFTNIFQGDKNDPEEVEPNKNNPKKELKDLIKKNKNVKLSFVSPEKGAENISGKSPVTFLFLDSIFDLENPETVAKKLKKQIKISPEIEGSWQILGTSGILFEPKTQWANSTHYDIEVSEDLVAGGISHDFETSRIKLNGILAYDLINKKSITLNFSQKVELKEVQKIIFKPNIKFDTEYVLDKDGIKNPKSVKIIPRENWDGNKKFKLIIPKGFGSMEGELRTKTDVYRNFRTINNFKISDSHKPDDVFQSFGINFTTPVLPKEFVKNLEITPTPEKELWEKYLKKITKEDYERNYFSLPPVGRYWDPNQTYEIKISKNLVDKYGRSLKKDFAKNFSAKFPTTFRQVFLPQHNTVLKPDTELNPTFWYSGNIIEIDVEIKEILIQKQKYSKIFKVEKSPNKEKFWTLNLKENFPEIFNENGDFLTGKYEINVKAIKEKNIVNKLLDEKFDRYDYWYPQEHNSSFYVSDFAVALKQFPQKKFEIEISEFPGDEKLPEIFSYQLYENKNHDNDFYGVPVEVQEKIINNTYIKPSNYWDFELVVKAGDKIGFGSRNFKQGINPNVSINQGFYERDQQRFMGFSDRPLYKPGQKVYFKSIFRYLNTRGKTFPLKKANFSTPKSFIITITDPRWNRLDPIEINGNNGSVDGYWDIPEDSPHGNYRFAIREKSGQHLGDFQIFVGEYRKSNFLLNGDFDKKQSFYKEGSTMKIKANFAFGGALSHRPVNYRVFLEGAHDCFWRYFSFSQNCGSQEKELTQGEGILDGNGEFQKPIDLDFEIDEKDPVWNNLKFRVTVKDGDTEENSLEKTIPFYMSTEKITLDRSSYYFEKNSEETLSGTITDWENKIKINKKISVKLMKIKPQQYRIMKNDTDINKEEKEEFIWEKEIVSNEFGKFLLNFTVPEKAGNYKIIFTSLDDKNRKTEISKIFWVPGVDDRTIRLKDVNKVLPLILDKEIYEVGETVEIFIPHNEWEILSSRATLERGEILEELPVNIENQTITLKTEKWMVPNVYVSVLLEGRDKNNNPKIKWGVINIPIVDSSRKLNIEINPNKKTYKPGETASFEIKTQAGGTSVPAELTVMIVDETLLSLKSRQKNDLLKIFLAKLPLGISLSHTIANFVSQDQIDDIIKQISKMELVNPEDEKNYAMAEMEIASDSLAMPVMTLGGAMKTKSMSRNKIMTEAKLDKSTRAISQEVSSPRENFQDTAKFIGKIYTDTNGIGTFDFQLPDNLTTWNIYVVGHTEQNNFGSKDASIKTKLPLLISELVPNFFQMGDEVEIGLLIRRDTEKIESEMVEVSLDLPKGFTTPETVKKINVAEEARVFFPLTITDKDYDMKEDYHKVKFGFSVKGISSGISDAVILERKLFPPKITLTAAEFLRIETEKILNIKPDIKRAIISKVLVKVFLSLAEKLGTLVDVADNRNYGCAEQRFSHSTAILIQKEFDNNLGRDSKPINKSLLKKNRDYIEKSFVNGGGFAFWKHENQANFWVTAQILEFADLWSKYGAEIDEQKITSSQKWLKQELLKKCDKKYDYRNCFSDSTRQNAAYVLAQDKQSYISSKDLNTLSAYTHSLEAKIWWLKTARILRTAKVPLLQSDQKRIEDFWTEIDSNLKARDRYVFWEESKDYWSFYSQNERLTSLIFEEILEENRLETYKHKVARYLSETKIKELSGNTALRLLHSLGLYAETNEKANLGAEYVVKEINENTLKEGTLDDLDSEYEIVKDVTKNSEFTGLKFEPKNEKPFYADIVLQETFPAKLVTPVSRGFWIDRAIYDVNDEDFEKPLTDLELGKNYVVRLKIVTNTSHRQIMIEDKIPSGSEFVNFDFDNANKELEKYTSANRGRNGGISPYEDFAQPYIPRGCFGWCRPTFDHKEFHAEKARYFANYLSAGTYEIKYIIKTRLSGKFEVLPARVEEMYYPEVFATTKGESIVIKK